jgi:hypothetical protein
LLEVTVASASTVGALGFLSTLAVVRSHRVGAPIRLGIYLDGATNIR